MKRFLIISILGILFSCNNEGDAIPWRKTNISFGDSNFLLSGADERNLYILFEDKFVSVGSDLSLEELVQFENKVWDFPRPIIQHNFLATIESGYFQRLG